MKKLAPLDQYERRYLRLLKMGPFTRRGGAWRFGANKMSNAVVERLVAAGRVVRDSERVTLPRIAALTIHHQPEEQR